jgi:hypothetical protein
VCGCEDDVMGMARDERCSTSFGSENLWPHNRCPGCSSLSKSSTSCWPRATIRIIPSFCARRRARVVMIRLYL